MHNTINSQRHHASSVVTPLRAAVESLQRSQSQNACPVSLSLRRSSSCFIPIRLVWADHFLKIPSLHESRISHVVAQWYFGRVLNRGHELITLRIPDLYKVSGNNVFFDLKCLVLWRTIVLNNRGDTELQVNLSILLDRQVQILLVLELMH